MSIVIQQQKSVIIGPNGGVAPSGAFGSAVTGGNDIIVCVFGNDNAANGPLTVVVSDGANTYNLVKDKSAGGVGAGCQYAAIYRATNVTGGIITLTVTFSGTFNVGQYSILGFNAYEVSGLDDTSASDATTSSSAASGNPITAGSLTPSVTGDLIIVCGSGTSYDGNAPNVGSGFTLDYAQVVNDPGAGFYNAQATESQINGGTSAVVCTFGSLPATGPGYAAAAAAFKAGASGPSPIAAAIAGTAAVTGNLAGSGALAAVINGTATIIAALSGNSALTATIAGRGIVSGTLIGFAQISATILGTSAVSATLIVGPGQISCAIFGKSTVTVSAVEPPVPGPRPLPYSRRTAAAVSVFACIFAAQHAMALTSTVSVISGLQAQFAALHNMYRPLIRQDSANQEAKLSANIAKAVAIITQLNNLLTLIVSTPQNAYDLANIRIVVANALTVVETASIDSADGE